MKAMILAAGKGKRMLPLTANCPKPLLTIGDETLIEHNIKRLRDAGFTDIVINHAYLGEQIEAHLGSGDQLGVTIRYSREGEPLETAGGIFNALRLLGDEAFVVINADIWCDFPLANLRERIHPPQLAHLVMVPNPNHNNGGDFFINDEEKLSHHGKQALTYSGIGVYHPMFFDGLSLEKLALRPLLDQHIKLGLCSGECFTGTWYDIGTPQRLEELRKQICKDSLQGLICH